MEAITCSTGSLAWVPSPLTAEQPSSCALDTRCVFLMESFSQWVTYYLFLSILLLWWPKIRIFADYRDDSIFLIDDVNMGESENHEPEWGFIGSCVNYVGAYSIYSSQWVWFVQQNFQNKT